MRRVSLWIPLLPRSVFQPTDALGVTNPEQVITNHTATHPLPFPFLTPPASFDPLHLHNEPDLFP